MRLTFLALPFALTACAADPVLLPDSGPCSNACGAGTVCSGGACVAVDAGAMDSGPSDAGLVVDDRMALPDFGPRDIGVDAGRADTGAVDAGVDATGSDVPADTYGACLANGIRECDGRNVMVQIGERDGGLVHHCGACGVTCATGEVCDLCRCAR